MKHILRFIKNQPPARLIVAGFFLIILTGACCLMLPGALRPGVHTSFLDALFTATSATCVTGLVTVDPGDTYTVFGRVILALLIQTGGLGFTSMGAGLKLATKRRVGFKSRLLLKEALNVDNFRGIVRLLKAYHLNFRNGRCASELSGLCPGLSAPEGARNQYLSFHFLL